MTDFIFMTEGTSYMFVTGPDVVKQVLNEQVTTDQLGGAKVHTSKSGVAQFVYSDDANLILGIKKLLTYIPSNNIENAPFVPNDDPTDRVEPSLRDIVPEDPDKPYDVRDVVKLVVDKGRFFEVAENFAQNIVVGFARLGGYTIGVIANQPKVMAGSLDIDSSVKGARFINFCDSFNIPIVTFEDVRASSWYRSGAPRHHPQWCKAPLRLHPCDCS